MGKYRVGKKKGETDLRGRGKYVISLTHKGKKRFTRTYRTKRVANRALSVAKKRTDIKNPRIRKLVRL